MEQREVETLVGDLEDWMFEVARLVRRGYHLSPEAVSFFQNLHPILDKLSEEMLEHEQNWNEHMQAEAEENNAYLQDAIIAVRAGG
jgi:tRNA/tmRNA/rRNA uracil-C5-methylase (TrmA/RlmC/RlmD family)